MTSCVVQLMMSLSFRRSEGLREKGRYIETKRDHSLRLDESLSSPQPLYSYLWFSFSLPFFLSLSTFVLPLTLALANFVIGKHKTSRCRTKAPIEGASFYSRAFPIDGDTQTEQRDGKERHALLFDGLSGLTLDRLRKCLRAKRRWSTNRRWKTHR